MTDTKDRDPDLPHLLTAEQIAALPERRHVHQFNEQAVRQTRSLGDVLGLTKLGLHLVRLEPGADSTTFHTHDADEEFVYILTGSGIAEIGDQRAPVGPGDFMAFPARSAAHAMHNSSSDEDLVYLMGGERNAFDVVHYPRLQRSMMKDNGVKRWMAWDDIHDV